MKTTLTTVFLLALANVATAQPDEPPPPDQPPVEPPKKVETPTPVQPPVVTTTAPTPSNHSQGWNEPHAVLFSLNNVLQVGSVLSEFQGLGVAFQKHRSPTSAIRAGVRLLRNAQPQQVTKTTTTT